MSPGFRLLDKEAVSQRHTNRCRVTLDPGARVKPASGAPHPEGRRCGVAVEARADLSGRDTVEASGRGRAGPVDAAAPPENNCAT